MCQPRVAVGTRIEFLCLNFRAKQACNGDSPLKYQPESDCQLEIICFSF